MKETTRYAVLLFAVLTFITSSYIAINTLSTDAGPETDNMNNDVNEPPQELNETDVNTSETDQVSGENSGQEEADGIIGKAVNGFRLLFTDIGEGIKILSD